MDIHTIRSESTIINACPVFVSTEIEGEYEPCDGPLSPIATYSVVGDDYGDWTVISVDFPCGHTFAQMQDSLRHAGEI